MHLFTTCFGDMLRQMNKCHEGQDSRTKTTEIKQIKLLVANCLFEAEP